MGRPPGSGKPGPRNYQYDGGLTTRQVTPEEADKYGIKLSILDSVQWFESTMSPYAPTVSLSKTGFTFSGGAVQDLGLLKGDYVRIGYNATKNVIVFQKVADARGIHLFKNKNQTDTLSGRCHSLKSWVGSIGVKFKRYVIHKDSESDAFYIKLS